jgi:predicted AlkP superfamily pyrophosphatase or phosphodiesterase
MSWFVTNTSVEKEEVNFVAWYNAQPDHVLHEYGFDSKELADVMTELDGLFGYVLQQIKAFNLQDRLNIIVTADHGHAKINRVTWC